MSPSGKMEEVVQGLRSSDLKARTRALDALARGMELDASSWSYDELLGAVRSLCETVSGLDSASRKRLLGLLGPLAADNITDGADDLLIERSWGEIREQPFFRAIRECWPSMLPALQDPGEGARAALLGLAAVAPPPDFSPLSPALKDDKPLVRGLAVLALARWGLFHGRGAEVAAQVRSHAEKGKGNEKTLATLALLQLAPSDETLRLAVAALPRKPSEVRHFPFFEGMLFSFAILFIAFNARAEDIGLITGSLVAIIEKNDFDDDVLYGCICAVFPELPRASQEARFERAPDDLPAYRRDFLKYLVQQPKAHWSIQRYMWWFADHGLPYRNGWAADELAIYLEMTPGRGMMKRARGTCEGASRHWPLYKWAQARCLGKVSDEDLLAVLATLPDADLIDTVIDLAWHGQDSRDVLKSTPGYDYERLVELGVLALRRRPGIRPLLVERIEGAARQKSGLHPKTSHTPLLLALLRGRDGSSGLQEDWDGQLFELLPACPKLAREIVDGLGPGRRERFIESTGFTLTAFGCGDAARPTAWHWVDLHQDRERLLPAMIAGLQVPDPDNRLQPAPKLRTAMLRAFWLFGPDIGSRLQSMVAEPTPQMAGIIASLQWGPPVDADIHSARWVNGACHVEARATDASIRLELVLSFAHHDRLAVAPQPISEAGPTVIELSDRAREKIPNCRVLTGTYLEVLALDALGNELAARWIPYPDP